MNAWTVEPADALDDFDAPDDQDAPDDPDASDGADDSDGTGDSDGTEDSDGLADDDETSVPRAARGSSGPAVVVVHDWYGPLPHLADFADELTMAGFDVELVDLYDEVTTDDPGRAEVLAEALDGPDALEQIAAAAERLRDGGASHVGAVGFSLGGSLVLRSAAAGEFDAVVVYYATCDVDDAARLTCPVQLHLAQHDEFESADDVEEFVAAVRAGGATVDDFLYRGTEHSFANADVALSDPHAAEVALARTIGFLHARLAG
ncbi:dienelactone hydrolase family protein [Pengzhenrongella phosphoraccumulans]|uniref:dienelactone hydrolase family protein n=1 Tax=Pengzhenrongella phosphoraccumulans TaxID=3114394 RepID=UPI00388E04F4